MNTKIISSRPTSNGMIPDLKTWVEIDRKNALHNVKTVRSILKKKTKLYAVVKSNAYGHGLREFSLIVNDKVDGFCVDSVYEGKTLRSVGIKKPILVLGPTISKIDLETACKDNLEVTISTQESLKQITEMNDRPLFHIKVDTGMHRQGFFVKDLQRIVGIIRKNELGGKLNGVYTHFASAKDITYPHYTNHQLDEFKKAQAIFKRFGFRNIQFSACGTGGTILYPNAHFDMVRTGIGLYGYWPSKESKIQHSMITNKELVLKPILSWKTKISEIKKLKKGDFIGYDLAEKINTDTTIAIIPIGYWHGFPRALSHKGKVLVRGNECRVAGKVSMDMVMIKCNDSYARVGDIVTIIGKSNGKTFTADDHMNTADTIIYTYEILTTINPLIKRFIV